MESEKRIDSALKLLVKSSLVVFAGLFLSKGLTYFYRIIIARHFGQEIYGIFSLAIMVLGWFVAFSIFGLTSGLLRYISLYRGHNKIDNIRFIFRFSTFITLLTSIFFGILLFLLAEPISIRLFHNIELIRFLKYFSFLVPLTVLSSCFSGALKAHEKIKLHTFTFNVVQNVGKVALLLLFLVVGLKTDAIVFSYVGAGLVMFIASYVCVKKALPEIFKKPKLNKTIKRAIARDMLQYSLPLMFFGIISSIFYWIDSLSIGYFKDVGEVGLYNSAVPIAQLLIITTFLFIQLFFPLITKEFSRKNFKLIKELSKQVTKWIFFINLPISLVLIFFPGAAINLLFGPDYILATNALRILAISSFVSSIFIVSNQLLSIAGKSKTLLFDMIFVSALNFILNFIFVPMPKIFFLDNTLGINGAAIATLISTIIFNFLLLVQANKAVSIIPIKKKMFHILLAGIIASSVLLYLRSIIEIKVTSILVLSIFFCLFYLLLVYLFKGLDKNDLMIIKAVKNKILKFS